MATEDEPTTEPTPSPTSPPVHHNTLSEEPRLPDLPEEEEHKADHEEKLRPGPSFGAGM